MHTVKLEHNQAALLLTLDENGEMVVDVIGQDYPSLSKEICEIIALKLINEADFQEEILAWTSEASSESSPARNTLDADTMQEQLKCT
ncbi:hypothetical protein [Desulfogranum japonicum]|uniref:hypothetical protein n=1 Tax=Desulfogranum japonicum TaxID=231447 RepID=UPI0004097040|nr:hypothetical protein [Desulfogranum japonicum]